MESQLRLDVADASAVVDAVRVHGLAALPPALAASCAHHVAYALTHRKPSPHQDKLVELILAELPEPPLDGEVLATWLAGFPGLPAELAVPYAALADIMQVAHLFDAAWRGLPSAPDRLYDEGVVELAMCDGDLATGNAKVAALCLKMADLVGDRVSESSEVVDAFRQHAAILTAVGA